MIIKRFRLLFSKIFDFFDFHSFYSTFKLYNISNEKNKEDDSNTLIFRTAMRLYKNVKMCQLSNMKGLSKQRRFAET